MAISPIGYAPHFTGTAKTAKGNEYQTTNTGKIVGTSVGATLGAANILRSIKLYDKFIKNIDNTFNEVGDADLTNALKHGNKIGKGFLIAGATIGALLITGVGFFAGKVYDNKQNGKLEKAADQAAETNKTATQA